MALEPLPATFADTRAALHRVASELVAPARKPDNEIALMVLPGGFGTPYFELAGVRTRVRVDADELVLEAGASERRARLDSIAAGARLLGSELLVGGLPEDDGPLGVDRGAALALARFYELADTALRRFAAELTEADAAGSPTLWPEHFDVAIEAGAEPQGLRANYGGSPGDAEHPEPYLYVGPWTAEVEGELWNAKGFSGAELGYAELAAAGDPEGAALEFLRSRRAALTP